MVAALILLVVLVVAWFDGGEEPLRPIEAAVDVPEFAPVPTTTAVQREPSR